MHPGTPSAAEGARRRQYWPTDAMDRFSFSVKSANAASEARSSGTKLMPAAMASSGLANRTSVPCTRTVPARASSTPKSAFSRLERPEPIRPVTPTISPGTSPQREVIDGSGREPLDIEHHLARHRSSTVLNLLDRAAHDELDEIIMGDVARRHRVDHAAVGEQRRPVRGGRRPLRGDA